MHSLNKSFDCQSKSPLCFFNAATAGLPYFALLRREAHEAALEMASLKQHCSLFLACPKIVTAFYVHFWKVNTRVGTHVELRFYLSSSPNLYLESWSSVKWDFFKLRSRAAQYVLSLDCSLLIAYLPGDGPTWLLSASPGQKLEH